jgi:hypothetical protein
MSPLASQRFSCAQLPTESRIENSKRPGIDCRAFCMVATMIASAVIDGLDDIVGHLLGVAQQHHRPVLVEQRIVDAGIP